MSRKQGKFLGRHDLLSSDADWVRIGIGVGTPSRIIDLLNAGMFLTVTAVSLAEAIRADEGRGSDVIKT